MTGFQFSESISRFACILVGIIYPLYRTQRKTVKTATIDGDSAFKQVVANWTVFGAFTFAEFFFDFAFPFYFESKTLSLLLLILANFAGAVFFIDILPAILAKLGITAFRKPQNVPVDGLRSDQHKSSSKGTKPSEGGNGGCTTAAAATPVGGTTGSMGNSDGDDGFEMFGSVHKPASPAAPASGGGGSGSDSDEDFELFGPIGAGGATAELRHRR